jgi:hypothetical protein
VVLSGGRLAVGGREPIGCQGLDGLGVGFNVRL